MGYHNNSAALGDGLTTNTPLSPVPEAFALMIQNMVPRFTGMHFWTSFFLRKIKLYWLARRNFYLSPYLWDSGSLCPWRFYLWCKEYRMEILEFRLWRRPIDLWQAHAQSKSDQKEHIYLAYLQIEISSILSTLFIEFQTKFGETERHWQSWCYGVAPIPEERLAPLRSSWHLSLPLDHTLYTESNVRLVTNCKHM